MQNPKAHRIQAVGSLTAEYVRAALTNPNVDPRASRELVAHCTQLAEDTLDEVERRYEAGQDHALNS